MMRIIFMGDGPWAIESLRRLVEEPVEIAAVVLRREPTDPKLAETARHLGLRVLQPHSIKDPDTISELASLEADLGLSVSYDQILSPAVLATARRGYVNFHAGKLPFYRGRSVLNWALINGETEIGVTAHYVDEGIDTGDIILQRTFPVGWTDTFAEVLDMAVAEIQTLVVETVDLFLAGEPRRRSQRGDTGSYFPRRREGDEWLDWSASSRDLYNKIRAITRPGPGARSWLGTRHVIVWRAAYDPGWPSYAAIPGMVLGVEDGVGIYVKTGDSRLLVQQVELDGDDGPVAPSWPIGTRLGRDIGRQMTELDQRVTELERRLRHPATEISET